MKKSCAAAALCVGAISSSVPAGGPVPVETTVNGELVQIGEMDVVIQPGGINIDFTLDEDYAFLDEWYDFQWINLEVGYTVDGVPQATDPVVGDLPAIDPQPGQSVGGALPDPDGDGTGEGDDKPWYYNDANWDAGVFGPDTIHTEGKGSKFVDYRLDPGVNSVITFHSYLVVESITDTAIGGREMCILGGIEWTYTESTGTTEWTATQLPVQGNADEVNDALENADPPFGDNWTATTGCELSECPYVYDCMFSSDGLVTFSPSIWTRDGVPIGVTAVGELGGGITPPAGVPVYECSYMPVVPNDWHWSATFNCEGTTPSEIHVWVVNFSPGDQIVVPLICSSSVFSGKPFMVSIDIGNDYYEIAPMKGPLIFQGQWSQYPFDIPPRLGFFPIGAQRQNFVLAPAGIVINEIRIDQPATDNDEYVEIKGPPGQVLDGLSYIVIGDNTAPQASGVVEAVVSLSGQVIPPTGLFLVAESTFTMGVPNLIANLNFENDDNVTHMLVRNFAGNVNQDLDLNNDGIFEIKPWQSIVDMVAMIKATNPPVVTEFHYGPPSVGPDDVFVPGQVYRCSTLGLWSIGDFALSPDDTPGQNNVGCSPTIPASGACCVGGDCIPATPGACAFFGGTYQGDGSACDPGGCGNPCPPDLNLNGVVDVDDLLDLINSWGKCDGCPADLDSNGVVDVDDLLTLINAWGPC